MSETYQVVLDVDDNFTDTAGTLASGRMRRSDAEELMEKFRSFHGVEASVEDAGPEPDERELGDIGGTTVGIKAQGPKSRWAVDVLSHKFKSTFDAIKQQAEHE